ncbi:pyridoxal phosphate-dependent aminotransferase [Methylovulum psychrotolerans]|uniref:histidinol-phosphate transaminase n=1 Tax=Methylovulum psychrotolerans TaxID=1704499 RepID=A0A2S5CFX6_9GAMM|nr:histidinol-phosphate transaminase [Methylovulum psychrotolerans]POZ49709.1 histidinol-phosphate transaminase [Methylovulum psychrotolerans]
MTQLDIGIPGFILPEYIAQVPPYQRGTSTAKAGPSIKMSSNENPCANEWLKEKIFLIANMDHSRYPNDDYPLLKKLIAELDDVELNKIFLGNGSSEILSLIARIFLNSERIVVQSEHTFPLLSICAKLSGASVVLADSKHYKHDPAALVSQIIPGRTVLYVDNPNNPIGSLLKIDELKYLIESTRGTAFLVIDEAYHGLVCSDVYQSAAQLCNDEKHVIVLRTFSKSFGMAGARVGYAIANPNIISILEKYRPPFNISSISSALACEALRDTKFTYSCAKYIESEMELMIQDSIISNHLVYKPAANYFSLRFEEQHADKITDLLMSAGILVKHMADDPALIRVSIGKPHENVFFRKSLSTALIKVNHLEELEI